MSILPVAGVEATATPCDYQAKSTFLVRAGSERLSPDNLHAGLKLTDGSVQIVFRPVGGLVELCSTRFLKYRRSRMARQGCPLQESEIRRIVGLLASTDMTLLNIAERTGRSHAAIAAVNRRFQVRAYGGRRSTWVVCQTPAAARAECQP